MSDSARDYHRVLVAVLDAELELADAAVVTTTLFVAVAVPTVVADEELLAIKHDESELVSISNAAVEEMLPSASWIVRMNESPIKYSSQPPQPKAGRAERNDVPEASFTVHWYGEDSSDSASSEMKVCELS